MESLGCLGSPVAVLADVHGNDVALRAVLADLDALGIGDIVVAGDMVGFGPSPDAVVDLLLSRSARMIRGNHEQDYVATYSARRTRQDWIGITFVEPLLWTMERLGSERRALLVALPDRLMLDERTIVVHGSPRHARDAILASTSSAELEAMFADESASLAFVGHSHRSFDRRTIGRRVVGVGSVGFPLDGSPHATYAIATRVSDGDPGDWDISIRRVGYDVEATIAGYRGGLGDADPSYARVLARQLRTGRSYLTPWLRASRDLSPSERQLAVRHFLAENP